MIEDSMDSILSKVYESGLTLKAGCGIGYEFSTLRPKDAYVAGAGAYTSGPLSFMDIYDKMCFTVSSAGGRRGAQMATFDISHPDVVDYIRVKREDGRLRQFNLSLLITSEFMTAVKNDLIWYLSFPLNRKEAELEGISLEDDSIVWRDWPIEDKYFTNTKGQVACKIVKSIPARRLWDIIMSSTYDYAEPGFILIDKVNEMNNNWWCEDIRATNPCITGDTKIAVAGRGPIKIRQLAKEGIDVPVYCQNLETGETLVKMGRNPRKTGKDHKVYKITLDDGSFFKANANHNMYLRDGSKVKVKDLEAGDSLIPFTLKRSKKGNIYAKTTDDYSLEYHLMLNCKYDVKFDYGRGKGKIHGHHLDENHFNNDMSNLEAILHEDHSSYHITRNNPMQTWWPQASEQERKAYRQRMLESVSGENNGMYGLTHSTHTKRLIGDKTIERFEDFDFRSKHSKSVSKAMNRPEILSKLRDAKLLERETIDLVCEWCEEPFVVEVISGRDTSRRFCSQQCVATYNSNEIANKPKSKETLEAMSIGSKKFANSKKGKKAKSNAGKVSIAKRALKCGSMLLYLGYKISQNTWDNLKSELHEAGIKPTVSAAWIDDYWNSDWKQFKQECKDYNHKVVSVEYCGTEDVYNITVDDVHNYCIVTDSWEEKGKTYWSGIVSANCGEQPLPPYGSCLLGSINLTKFINDPFTDKATFDYSRYRKVIRIFARMLDNVVEINGLPLEKQRQEIEYKRRHGMGYLGLGSALTMLRIKYGSPESLVFTEEVTKILAVENWKAALELAKEKGPAPIMEDEFKVTGEMLFKRPEMVKDGITEGEVVKGKILHGKYSRYMQHIASIEPELVDELIQVGARFTHSTSIAPTGTLSLSVGNNVDNGIEPAFAHHYFRNVIKEGKKSKEQIDVFSFELWAYRQLVDH